MGGDFAARGLPLPGPAGRGAAGRASLRRHHPPATAGQPSSCRPRAAAGPSTRAQLQPGGPPPTGLSYGSVTSQVQKDRTTQVNLVQMFGGPSISTMDAEGNEVWMYERSVTETERQNRSEGYQSAANLGLFFSAGNIAGGGSTGKSSSSSSTSTTFRTLTVILEFHPNKTVKDYSVRASQF